MKGGVGVAVAMLAIMGQHHSKNLDVQAPTVTPWECFSGTWYQVVRIPSAKGTCDYGTVDVVPRDCTSAEMQLYCNGHLHIPSSTYHLTTPERNNLTENYPGIFHFEARQIDYHHKSLVSNLHNIIAPPHFVVLKVASDWSYMVLVSSTRILWVLSRTALMDEILVRQILYETHQQGFDTRNAERVSQGFCAP